ncbi:hypothetical protein [Streptomyces uncialis]|uniref:hypothetical protein n=1 Tax=Streptomyces uncialis TaxID=1048205 RepID=UPI00224F0316|nr:hypothetical protein [Streptomyces uncialis]MCX4657788.1 hypothetical protein [Streptomyces uncialis]
MTIKSSTKRNTVAAVAALGVAFSVTAAAQAGAQPAAAPAEQQSAAAPSYYLKFDKGTVTNSRLSLMRSVSGPDRVIKSYKAGSGTSTNTCAVGKGWLPNGKYRIEFRRTDFDGLINGYVIKVTDKRCHNGTKRTELFIHSEMKPNGGQGRIESEKHQPERLLLQRLHQAQPEEHQGTVRQGGLPRLVPGQGPGRHQLATRVA